VSSYQKTTAGAGWLSADRPHQLGVWLPWIIVKNAPGTGILGRRYLTDLVRRYAIGRSPTDKRRHSLLCRPVVIWRRLSQIIRVNKDDHVPWARIAGGV
jgi:hypothetical protein